MSEKDSDVSEAMTRCANILSCALAAAGANETDDPATLVGASFVALVDNVSTSHKISKKRAMEIVYSLATTMIRESKKGSNDTGG